jgi:hypothetical protein
MWQKRDRTSFVFGEKLLGYFCDRRFAKVLLVVFLGLAELGVVWSSLCWLFGNAEVHGMPKFGGGSGRTRALLGNPV